MDRNASNEAMRPPLVALWVLSEPSGSSRAATLLGPRLATETGQDTTACDRVSICRVTCTL